MTFINEVMLVGIKHEVTWQMSRSRGSRVCNLTGKTVFCYNTCKVLWSEVGLDQTRSHLTKWQYHSNNRIISTTSRWFGESDVVVAYALWLNTHICLGTHLYRQRHLQTAPCLDRILFTALSTTMFNFGSVLLWASIKQIIPDRSGQRTLLSVGIGTCLLWMGQRYVNFINKNF